MTQFWQLLGRTGKTGALPRNIGGKGLFSSRTALRLSRRPIAIILALAIVAPAPPVIAQNDSGGSANTDSSRNNLSNRRDRCRLVKVKKGETAVLVPTEKFTEADGRKFPYLGSQQGLKKEFQVEDDRAEDCAGYFGIPYAGSGAVATGPTAVASAAAAAPAGLAPVGLAPAAIAGGAITAGAALGIGLGVIAIGAGVAVMSSGGGSGGTGPSTGTQQ